jgi:hypothetical protein
MTTATTGTIQVEAEHLVQAPALDVYSYIADYRNHHPNFLPGAFSDLVVEKGGIGSGTVISFNLKLAGMTRRVRATVDEADPGSVLKEISLDSDGVTTFEVIPHGAAALVRIHTEWTPPAGIQGWFERRFAPKMLSDLFREELINLDLYAGAQTVARSRRELAGMVR